MRFVEVSPEIPKVGPDCLRNCWLSGCCFQGLYLQTLTLAFVPPLQSFFWGGGCSMHPVWAAAHFHKDIVAEMINVHLKLWTWGVRT